MGLHQNPESAFRLMYDTDDTLARFSNAFGILPHRHSIDCTFDNVRQESILFGKAFYEP